MIKKKKDKRAIITNSEVRLLTEINLLENVSPGFTKDNGFDYFTDNPGTYTEDLRHKFNEAGHLIYMELSQSQKAAGNWNQSIAFCDFATSLAGEGQKDEAAKLFENIKEEAFNAWLNGNLQFPIHRVLKLKILEHSNKLIKDAATRNFTAFQNRYNSKIEVVPDKFSYKDAWIKTFEALLSGEKYNEKTMALMSVPAEVVLKMVPKFNRLYRENILMPALIENPKSERYGQESSIKVFAAVLTIEWAECLNWLRKLGQKKNKNNTGKRAPISFESLFQAGFSDNCFNVLTKLESVLSKDGKFIGNNKGVIVTWIKAVKEEGFFTDKRIHNTQLAQTLNEKMPGLNIDPSELGKPYKRIETSDVPNQIKHLFSEFSRLRKTGK